MAAKARSITFAKVAADLDMNPKVRKAGPLGRAVYEFVLRRNAARGATGAVPIEDVDPDYMASMLMQPAPDLATGLERAVAARLLAIEGEDVVITGWDDEWARTALNPAERKRAERARKRGTPDRDASRDVTSNVTPGSGSTTDQPLTGVSRDVTAVVTVTDQRDQIRSEEREGDVTPPPPAPGRPRFDRHAQVRFDGWKYAVARFREIKAEHAIAGPDPWTEIPMGGQPENDLHQRVNELITRYPNDYDRALAEVKRAVDVRAAEAIAKRDLKFFTPRMLWREDQFGRALELDPASFAPRTPAPARRDPMDREPQEVLKP